MIKLGEKKALVHIFRIVFEKDLMDLHYLKINLFVIYS